MTIASQHYSHKTVSPEIEFSSPKTKDKLDSTQALNSFQIFYYVRSKMLLSYRFYSQIIIHYCIHRCHYISPLIGPSALTSSLCLVLHRSSRCLIQYKFLLGFLYYYLNIIHGILESCHKIIRFAIIG